MLADILDSMKCSKVLNLFGVSGCCSPLTWEDNIFLIKIILIFFFVCKFWWCQGNEMNLVTLLFTMGGSNMGLVFGGFYS